VPGAEKRYPRFESPSVEPEGARASRQEHRTYNFLTQYELEWWSGELTVVPLLFSKVKCHGIFDTRGQCYKNTMVTYNFTDFL
jgi:hypothetical protein